MNLGKRHGWQLPLIMAFMQSLNVSFVEAGRAFESCFSSSFSRAIGSVLHGFLIGEIDVSSVIECKRRCVLAANCLSLNILTKADGSFLCQLNSARKENGAKGMLVKYEAGEYYGLKVGYTERNKIMITKSSC